MMKLCSSQEVSKDNLKGKWILIEKNNSLNNLDTKLSENVEEEIDNKENQFVVYLIFKENDSLILNQMGQEYQTKFELKDSILILGNRKYHIIEIGQNELHLKDDSELMPTEYLYKKQN
jgi:hypothetical protein